MKQTGKKLLNTKQSNSSQLTAVHPEITKVHGIDSNDNQAVVLDLLSPLPGQTHKILVR